MLIHYISHNGNLIHILINILIIIKISNMTDIHEHGDNASLLRGQGLRVKLSNRRLYTTLYMTHII